MTRQPDWVGHLDVKRAIRGLIDRPRIASFPEASDNEEPSIGSARVRELTVVQIGRREHFR